MRARTTNALLAAAAAATVLAGLAGAVPTASSSTDLTQRQRYLVVLAGVQGDESFTATGTSAAVDAAVAAAGGTVANDLSKQKIGVLVVESSTTAFAAALSSSSLVQTVGKDKKFKGLPDGGPEQTADPLESLQWDMLQIRAPQAHNFQAGSRSVDVGILDSGIDGRHPDFLVDGKGSNVDCARGRNSVSFLPSGPGVGSPDPCVDNQFHGTHVAGTVAAQANGIGVVGVAPNVTLVPVKVCDASGYCSVSAVVDAITYAGDIKLDVINMSFFPTRRSARSGSRSSGRSSTPAAAASCRWRRSGLGRGPLRSFRRRRKRLRRRPGRDRRCDRRLLARQPESEGELLELRQAGQRRRRSGRLRHHRRLPHDDPLDAPGRRVRLHPGHVDGLAARGGRGGADRQPVRQARPQRRRRARARQGRGDPRALGDRHRPSRLRHVLRERPDRRAPGDRARLLVAVRRYGAVLPRVHGRAHDRG